MTTWIIPCVLVAVLLGATGINRFFEYFPDTHPFRADSQRPKRSSMDISTVSILQRALLVKLSVMRPH